MMSIYCPLYKLLHVSSFWYLPKPSHPANRPERNYGRPPLRPMGARRRGLAILLFLGGITASVGFLVSRPSACARAIAPVAAAL